jgi:hypothetical protein
MSHIKYQNLIKIGRGLITKAKPAFTGSCPVRQHTGDGNYVGRCYHSTYNGRCHLHGDVSRFLGESPDLTDADDRLIDRTGSQS